MYFPIFPGVYAQQHRNYSFHRQTGLAALELRLWTNIVATLEKFSNVVQLFYKLISSSGKQKIEIFSIDEKGATCWIVRI